MNISSNKKPTRGLNACNDCFRTAEKDGEVWFVAKDVCDVLGLKNVSKALETLEKDELTLLIVRAGTQSREMNGVNESGLYNLIFQ